MKFYKITFLALSVFCIAFVVKPCAAKTYMHPEHIYSFEYPKSWIVKKHPSLDMVFFGPSAKKGGAFCISRPEKMTGSPEKTVEEIIKSNLDIGVSQEAIKAADPGAEKFETDMFHTANSVANRTIFESKDKSGGLDKAAMILTYNLDTGHTIDITCRAPADQWPKYGEVFTKIQSSLRTYGQADIQKMVGKDFVGDKKEWVLRALTGIRKFITELRLRGWFECSAGNRGRTQQAATPLRRCQAGFITEVFYQGWLNIVVLTGRKKVLYLSCKTNVPRGNGRIKRLL